MKTRILRRWSPAALGNRGTPLPLRWTTQVRNVILLLALCAAPVLARAGAEVLLYPFARAFGSPKESELAKCREAFGQFQDGLPTTRVVAAPVLVMGLKPGRGTPEWRTDLAEQLARRVSAANTVRIAATNAPPAIASPAMGHNQLRYAWERANAYGKAVKAAPAGAEHVLFTEVWTNSGKVAAIHVFLVTPTGQVAYCRWFNSHQFGDALTFEGDGWIEFAAPQILRDLRRKPEEVFPRYGVG